MGQIVLSADELVCILSANALVPDQVAGIETDGDEIRVKVATSWPLLKSIHVRVRVVGFEQGQVVVQLVTNRVMDKFDWLVDRMLASLQFQDHGARWEYPKLYVDVNKLLQQQVRGVEVTNVVFADGCFHITTRHSAGSAGAPQAAPGAAAPSAQTPQP